MSSPDLATPLDIAVVLPERLNTHADVGNADTLRKHASWGRVQLRTHFVREPGDWPRHTDAVLLGDGALEHTHAALTELLPLRDDLVEAQARGVPMLAVGLGMHLLSASIRFADQAPLPGLGLLAGTSMEEDKQVSGELVISRGGQIILGYENHRLSYQRAGAESPLGVIVHPSENRDRFEGVAAGNIVGTELHGPVLAKNPDLAVSLLTLMLERRHPGVRLHQSRSAAVAAELAAQIRLASIRSVNLPVSLLEVERAYAWGEAGHVERVDSLS
ncbi:hypothetical protein [Pseudoclavibacter helvolus]|uniref:hypothetical protein n=1 Tax=Pseudoclavibacter helvolus TaxID=255205 RepID=UPI0024ACE31E|nr:hypothetical protein [Pseudoclavibacter helvolus]